jgi:tRNA dimethylallyltransferase
LSAPPSFVVALFGPTGTGKTALACAIAERVPCRLISCDAVQVYRGLEAASAKPTADERRGEWALVDWVEPTQDVNMGAWVRAAEAEIREAHRRGLVPLVAGGTGLYLRGLAKGVAEAPARDEALRRRLRRLAARHGGPEWLHRVLRRLDPELAAQLGARDEQRVVRGLEVRLRTGRALSEMQGGGWRGPDRWPLLRVGISVPREVLYPRLDRRVELFFAAGLVAEVRDLLEREGLPAEANALRGLGYREVTDWLTGRSEARSLDEVVEEVQRNTRRYAKRQMTWFRKETPATWHDAREPDLAERIARAIEHVAAGRPAGLASSVSPLSL